MDKNYNHGEYEGKIYELWEKSGAFSPNQPINQSTNQPFVIIMPPPNANDPLHIGHAREVSIQDSLIRFHRMKGESTLWLPGADHAGIETQYVFEKKLAKEDKSRFDFDRETLYQMIWDYVQANKSTMEGQLRRLGASCDWTREKFTLDPKIVEIVYATFKKLHDDGLVYRGERIVNFCPRCGTAYSQLEVEPVERDDNLYYLDYGSITIATTRPETIFADVAVAVNPKDKKNKGLIGKSATIPLINREVPVISDELVDPAFGTGALKITPGHDATDFEIGQKHNLETLSVIDGAGRMINTPEKYRGMKAAAAREEVVKDLEAAGKLTKTETIHHLVGTCYRDHGVIEPMISKQWFVKVEPLTKPALSAIKSGAVRFTAKKYEKIAVHWLTNLKDWNVSRQIVWGIQIPAWQCQDCREWVITGGKAADKCPACGSEKLIQDTDTFDTWFSSGQWPYATLMTAKPGDFDYFYPTSVMSPAYDIIPFWVIRMIMLGLYRTGKVPFKEVLIHGLVRDKNGVKISKSKGNVIDPIEMAEKYGADALRMALIWGSKVENDNSLSEENVRGQRNFANKIWNIARFVTQNEKTPRIQNSKTQNKDDKWIVEELEKTTQAVTHALDEFRLNEAAEEIYEFVWHRFADVYIEKFKNSKNPNFQVLSEVLSTSLRLLHPFMPYVSEVIWQQSFAKDKKDLLITSLWP